MFFSESTENPTLALALRTPKKRLATTCRRFQKNREVVIQVFPAGYCSCTTIFPEDQQVKLVFNICEPIPFWLRYKKVNFLQLYRLPLLRIRRKGITGCFSACAKGISVYFSYFTAPDAQTLLCPDPDNLIG